MEEWIDIPGYEGMYQVSDKGAVRSFKKNRGYMPPRILKLTQNKNGYKSVTLCRNGDERNIEVQRLSLLSFEGPCPDGMQACHNNGHPWDNRRCNLRWDTPRNNQFDRRAHGTMINGSNVNHSKLTAEQVIEMRCLRYLYGYTYGKLAVIFNINRSNACRICNGEMWKHI
jgi:hypothetical protein